MWLLIVYNNRPFAANGHMVQKTPLWWESYSMHWDNIQNKETSNLTGWNHFITISRSRNYTSKNASGKKIHTIMWLGRMMGPVIFFTYAPRDSRAGGAGGTLGPPLFARTTFRFQNFLGEDSPRPPCKLSPPPPPPVEDTLRRPWHHMRMVHRLPNLCCNTFINGYPVDKMYSNKFMLSPE